MRHAMTGCTIVVLFVGGTLAAEPVSADRLAITGDVTATTDYMFRGVSQTMSGAALQGSFGVAHDSGLTAWVWGSNVDYVADGGPDDGARIEIDAVVAYERALTERVTATVGRSQYFIPGVDHGIDYDYGEWWGGFVLDERHHVTAYRSGNVFGSGEPGWYVVAGTGTDLFAGLALDVAVGHGGLGRALGDAYNHVELSLSGAFDALTWRLAFHAADERAKTMFYESTVEPRLVLSVTYTVWE